MAEIVFDNVAKVYPGGNTLECGVCLEKVDAWATWARRGRVGERHTTLAAGGDLANQNAAHSLAHVVGFIARVGRHEATNLLTVDKVN